MNKPLKHYEESVLIPVSPQEVFAFVDDHTRFSSHMTKSTLMMGGEKMNIQLDENEGKKVGSHIRMDTNILGIKIFLDEVVTVHSPPYKKGWKTVGDINLVVIGHYTMALEITPKESGSALTVSIDYELPDKLTWLGILFGGMYAKWCVRQMIGGTKDYFAERKQ